MCNNKKKFAPNNGELYNYTPKMKSVYNNSFPIVILQIPTHINTYSTFLQHKLTYSTHYSIYPFREALYEGGTLSNVRIWVQYCVVMMIGQAEVEQWKYNGGNGDQLIKSGYCLSL